MVNQSPRPPSSNCARILLFLLTVILILANGCGYRVASQNRLAVPFKTLAVRPLVNQTTTYEVEQILTRALVREFVKRSSLSIIQDDGRADAVLEGRIRRITVNPVTFARSAFASTFLVTVYADIQVSDTSSKQVLFEENNYIFREQYVVNVDVKNFFTEANPALERISRDFAASVVTLVIEDF